MGANTERAARESIPPRPGRQTVPVPDSATPQRGGGRLELDVLARDYAFDAPDGSRRAVRAVTVFLVEPTRDVTKALCRFGLRIPGSDRVDVQQGIVARHDLSGYRLDDEDVRVADLHYRDVAEYAVGRNISASWADPVEGKVTSAWTDPFRPPRSSALRRPQRRSCPASSFGWRRWRASRDRVPRIWHLYWPRCLVSIAHGSKRRTNSRSD